MSRIKAKRAAVKEYTPEELLSMMRDRSPVDYMAAEEVALDMIDKITDESKKFPHLSFAEDCYWMHLAAYVDYFIKYLRAEHHRAGFYNEEV